MEPTATTNEDLERFFEAIPNETRRADAKRLAALMTDVTGERPALWGRSIVGFGTHHYRYATGREGDTVRVGFAPRAANLVLYLTIPLDYAADVFERLGPHRKGKGCVYLTRLSAIDEGALRELVERSYQRAGAD